MNGLNPKLSAKIFIIIIALYRIASLFGNLITSYSLSTPALQKLPGRCITERYLKTCLGVRAGNGKKHPDSDANHKNF